MWACKVPSFLFYPEIPNVPGLRWTWPVFLCVYLLFSPLSLCCSRARVFPVSAGPFFSQQSSFLAHHSVVGAAALWQHHLCPRAQLTVPPPPPQP